MEHKIACMLGKCPAAELHSRSIKSFLVWGDGSVYIIRALATQPEDLALIPCMPAPACNSRIVPG